MKRNKIRRFLQQKQYTIASFVLFAAIAAMTGVYMSNKVTDRNNDTEMAQKQKDLANQEIDWDQDHLPKSGEEQVESVTSVIKPKGSDKAKDTKTGKDSDSQDSDSQDSDPQDSDSQDSDSQGLNGSGKKEGIGTSDKIGTEEETSANTNTDATKGVNQMDGNSVTEDGNALDDAVKQGENAGQSAGAESNQQQDTATQAKTAQTINLHFSPKSDLSWPLQGDVIMNYSMDQTVYFATLEQYKYNPALIIAGKVNDPVNAAATGKITDISTNEETGMTVSMDLGDGYTAIYGQLKEVLYKEDAIVEAGNAIGYIAEPTKYYSVEGSNLYFELQKDNKPVNPMQYIQ